MARIGLLLLVGALAVSATKFFDESSPSFTEKVFRPGVEYTYKYDSQVLTGIPNGGSQYSGLKIKCLVRLHMKSPSLVVMKLDEVKLCEVNTDLHSALPSEMIPEELCTYSTSDHFRVMITELVKPISFRYDYGLVSRLESDISDPFWSVNIKRAVLNLLHVSLRQEREVSDISPEYFAETTDFTLRNVINKDRTFDKIFKVKEHDVVGDCETLYAVYEKDPTFSYCSECFYVTKVKDYKRCTDKVIYEQGLFAGHSSWMWLPNDERKSLVTPVTHVSYEMSGTRTNFLINKAKLHSEYIFTPYSHEGGSMVTYVKCHLTLVATDAISSSLGVISSPVVHKHALLLHVPHALTSLSSKGLYTPDAPSSSYYPDMTRSESMRYGSEYESKPYGHGREYESKPYGYGRESSYRYGRDMPYDTDKSTEYSSEYMTKRGGSSFDTTYDKPYASFPEEEGEESSWDDSLFSKWDSSYKKFDWSSDISAMTTTSNIDKVRVMLKEIMMTMTPYVTEETPTKLIYLKRVLETCTSDELWTIVTDMCSLMDSRSEPEFKKIKEIILDLLPVVPKPIVPHIIRSLVSKGVIYPKRGAYMISLYSLMAPASPRIVKSMLSVCKHPVMLKTDVQLKRTCFLGLGTVTHKLFSMHLKTKVPKYMSFGVFDEVVREIRTMCSTTTSLEMKLLLLKTAGNTGLPEFLPELHRVIREKSSAPILRRVAIMSLRRITILAPTEVSKICLPIFMDSRETSDVRTACFLMVMYTKPRTSTVMLMVHRLRHDPSANLKSFVYSYLSTLSQTSLPVHHQAAKAAKMAMLAMKPYDFGFSHSKGYHFDVSSEKFDMGAMMESFLIHTPTSVLPKGIIVKLGAVLAHHPLYLFETGLFTKGMDDVISSIYRRTRPTLSRLSSYDWSRFLTPEWYKDISPEVSSWFSSSDKFDVRDWLKSFELPSTTSWDKADWGSVGTTMRDILSKIKFEDRSYDLPELLTYFKILSNDVTFFNIDKDVVSEFISTIPTDWLSTFMSSYSYGGLGSPIPINVVKTLPLIDNCLVIPTTMGMPLHLNFTALAITKVTGHVTPVSLPSLRELFFTRSIPDEMKVAVDVKPSFAVKMLCEMGVHFNVMKATTVVKGYVSGHVPIKSEILLNWADKKFKLTWEVPQESFTPLKVGMKVLTRIFKLPLRHYHLITATPSFNVERDIVHPTVIKSVPISMSPIATVFGMHLGLTSELFTRHSSWSPFYPLCGRFHFHVTCTPFEERPKLAEFKVILGSSYPSEYYSSRSSMDRTETSSYDDYDILSSVFPSRKDYRSSFRDEFESDWTTVTPVTEVSNPRSRHVTMVMRTVGGSRTRFVQTHMTWIHSYDYLTHQFNYQISGSPIFGWSSIPMKASLDSFICLKSLFRPYATPDSLVAKVDFYYGDKSSAVESDFSLKVLSGRTGMSWESDYSPLSRYSWYSSNTGDKYEYSCSVRHSRLPIFVEDKLVYGLEYLKYKLHPYLYVKKTGLTSDIHKCTAYIKVVPMYKKLTAIINTPTEVDYIVDVPTFSPFFMPETVSLVVPSPVLMTEGFTPSYTSYPEEYSTRSSPRWSWYKSFTSRCTVTENMVKTFDDVTYTIPEMPTSCETILARDCSSMGRWMVTMMPVSSSMKVVRVLVPHYELKLVPTSSYEMIAYINGIPKTLSSGQPIVLSETSTSSSGDIAYSISKEGDSYKIECMNSGAIILTNGKLITIRSESKYRGRVCGLCGNYDSNMYNDYEGPMKTLYERPEHFVVKYTIPSAECSVSDLSSKHGVPSEVVYGGECQHEMRNIAKVTYLNGEKKVCFSLKPEPVCSESCKRINPRPKYVSFHCLPAGDVTTLTLMRERSQRVLGELAWKRVDLTDYIDTQDKCVSTY